MKILISLFLLTSMINSCGGLPRDENRVTHIIETTPDIWDKIKRSAEKAACDADPVCAAAHASGVDPKDVGTVIIDGAKVDFAATDDLVNDVKKLVQEAKDAATKAENAAKTAADDVKKAGEAVANVTKELPGEVLKVIESDAEEMAKILLPAIEDVIKPITKTIFGNAIKIVKLLGEVEGQLVLGGFTFSYDNLQKDLHWFEHFLENVPSDYGSVYNMIKTLNFDNVDIPMVGEIPATNFGLGIIPNLTKDRLLKEIENVYSYLENLTSEANFQTGESNERISFQLLNPRGPIVFAPVPWPRPTQYPRRPPMHKPRLTAKLRQ